MKNKMSVEAVVILSNFKRKFGDNLKIGSGISHNRLLKDSRQDIQAWGKALDELCELGYIEISGNWHYITQKCIDEYFS